MQFACELNFTPRNYWFCLKCLLMSVATSLDANELCLLNVDCYSCWDLRSRSMIHNNDAFVNLFRSRCHRIQWLVTHSVPMHMHEWLIYLVMLQSNCNTRNHGSHFANYPLCIAGHSTLWRQLAKSVIELWNPVGFHVWMLVYVVAKDETLL